MTGKKASSEGGMVFGGGLLCAKQGIVALRDATLLPIQRTVLYCR
jgi:hypothetical protein